MIFGLKTVNGEQKVIASSIKKARIKFNEMGYIFKDPKLVYRISMDNILK